MARLELSSLSPIWLYIIFYAMAIIPSAWYIYESVLVSKNALGIGIGAGFAIFATTGFILLLNKIDFFREGDGGERVGLAAHLHSFWLFFAISMVLNWAAKSVPLFSVLSIPKYSLLSAGNEGLSFFTQILGNSWMAVFGETFLFVLFLFIAEGVVKMIGAMARLDEERHATVLNLMFVAAYIGISIPIFFLFHVTQFTLGFLIAITGYRIFMGVLYLGDKLFNWLKFITVVLGAEFGYHLGNNIVNDVGVQSWFLTMLSHPVGWVLMSLLGFLLMVEAVAVHQALFGRGD